MQDASIAHVTDEQFAIEIRDLFADAARYEGMKSAALWQITDRLTARYPRGVAITETIAFITKRSLSTLNNMRTTGWAWPHDRRRKDVPYGAHESLNASSDRFELIHQVAVEGATTDSARGLVGRAPTRLPETPEPAEPDIYDPELEERETRADQAANDKIRTPLTKMQMRVHEALQSLDWFAEVLQQHNEQGLELHNYDACVATTARIVNELRFYAMTHGLEDPAFSAPTH